MLETERLVLRQLSTDDAAFILGLLNEPAWLQFIGDRGVRTLADARAYIVNGPREMYARLGFGLYLTEQKTGGAPMGLCGLLKRDTLEDVDIGFAFLPKFWAQGYAFEAASAVLMYARKSLGLKRVVAITALDNQRSIKLLGKLGLRFEKQLRVGSNDKESKLFAIDFD